MKRRDFLKNSGLAAFGAFPFVSRNLQEMNPGKRPNFLFILTDDQRWDALGCMGHPFLKTPHIDRVRSEGALFANAFVTTSLCAPSRAGFLTGCYPSRHGVINNLREYNPDITPPFPLLLQKAGYKTAYIGKWHQKYHDNPRKGFDYWLSFTGQGRYFDPKLNENGRRFKEKGYMTDILTDYALGFLDRQIKNTPFCLVLAHKAVHQPFKPAPGHRGAFRGQNIPEPAGFGDTLESKPAWQRSRSRWVKRSGEKIPDSIPGNDPWKTRQGHINYFRTLLAVDESVGKILEKLELMGELDNTVIVFSSDNGFLMGEHGRSDKRVAYEESIRIPMIMRCPGLVKPGTTIDDPVLNIDLAPTFLDIAGVNIPGTMQGMSMAPLFKRHSHQWRKSIFYSYWMERTPSIPRMVAVRTKNFKLIRYPDINDIDEMYHLKNDPHEMNNIARQPGYAPEKAELTGELDRLMKETGYLANVPDPGDKDETPTGKQGLLLDLSFDQLSQNKVVNRCGKDFIHQVHRVKVNMSGGKTGAVFSDAGYIAFEDIMMLHPSIGQWTAELFFKPEQDGIVFSLGVEGNFVMVIVEKGIPCLVIGRSPAVFVVEGHMNCLGKWTHLEASIDPVRSQLFLNGQKSCAMIIRNPLKRKQSRLILGYHPTLTPNDRFVPSKRERFLPEKSFTGEIEGFKISREKEMN